MEKKQGLWLIHIAVLLFGLSGVFVKLIPLSAPLITLGRCLVSCAFLYTYIHIKKYNIRLNHTRHYFWNITAGFLLAVHWTMFIVSIQMSTVAIGTLTYATYPLFVVLLEPYVFKERFLKRNIVVIAFILIGIYQLTPSLSFNDQNTIAIICGLISSLAYALLSLINRRLSRSYDSVVISFYEQFIALILITLYVYYVRGYVHAVGDALQFFYLIIYGLLFTAIAHSLYISGLKRVKTQTASIISSLEPVYSITFAALFLHEIPTSHEMSGALFIIIAVIYASLKEKWEGVKLWKKH